MSVAIKNKENLTVRKETASRYDKYFHQTSCIAVDNSPRSRLISVPKIIVNDIDHRSIGITRCIKRQRVSSSDEDGNNGQTRSCVSPVSPEISCLGQRRRADSSDEESISETTGRSVSPEIPYGGSPAAYKLRELEGEFLIIKVPMDKSGARSKKCSDKDIIEILDSESDEELMFGNVKRNRVNVVGSLSGRLNNSESTCSSRDIVPNKAAISYRSRSRNTVQGPIAGSSRDLSQEDDDDDDEEPVSLRLKLRRSTEQSNYKVQKIFDGEESTHRSSKRSDVSIPKRYASENYEEDRSARKKTRGTAKALTEEDNSPIKTVRRNRCHIYGPEHCVYDMYRLEFGYKKGRRSAARESIRIETPPRSRNTFEEAVTPRSLRDTRQINYNEIDKDKIKNTLDKENKSENDIEEDSDSPDSRRRTRSQLERPVVGTPRKEVILKETSTPKRTPRQSTLNLRQETPNIKTSRRLEMEKVSEEPGSSRTPRGTPGRRRISRTIDSPSMRKGNLTPSMSRRTANIGKPITILEDARAKLHVSAVPKSLPCREIEFNDIYQFLERKLLDNSSGCIYISGVPGTGKTATVNEVIRCLKKLVVKGEMDNFDFIEINGMKLSEPRQAYVQILKQINGQTATWQQANEILETLFTQSSSKRPMTLLLVDELDLLCNKRQDVVYNLLDWPSKKNARLVVITIANTMDLPERVLMGRVTSRLGLTRLTFQPYNYKQLQEIVMARLKDSVAFKSEAIQLVARKVAAVSGDARRALDICRRATEIAERNDGKNVTMKDVNEALSEMISGAKVRAIKHCSLMERMFLRAVCSEAARTGVEETSFDKVYQQLVSLCLLEGLETPNVTQTLRICGRLGAYRLLLCEHSRSDIQQRIFLNVSTDDIYYALQEMDTAH